MHRIITGRRLATVAVSSALTVCAFGGSAWACPGGNGQHTVASNPTLSSPQPASNADFTGNGANVHGVYDSTRNGDASANGNGGGQASGKPCAGCVGKADNKNPKGQMPGPSDNNAGYECDRNHGIGRGNPAHTGCTTTSVVVTPPVVAPVTTPVTPVVAPDVTPVVAPVVAPVTAPVVAPVTESAGTPAQPAEVEAVKVVKPATSGKSAVKPGAAVVGAIEAAAASKPAGSVPGAKVLGAKVLGEHVTRAPGAAVEAAGVSALPFTGAAHTQGFVLAALLLLSVGGALVFGGRRRTTV